MMLLPLTDACRALELPITAVCSAFDEQTTAGLTSAEREQFARTADLRPVDAHQDGRLTSSGARGRSVRCAAIRTKADRAFDDVDRCLDQGLEVGKGMPSQQ